jgi:DNA invertase Pin-like site-specific DNA recombinase
MAQTQSLPKGCSQNVCNLELPKLFGCSGLFAAFLCLQMEPFMYTVPTLDMEETVKICIYARVSTTKQDNDNQLIQLREFACKQSGWEVAAEYVDTVTGSGKKDRVQFDRMMLAASQRQFDVLLFWKLDRLSREGVRKTLVYLERLDSWGVRWRSFMEPFFDSCGIMRDVVISIMATLAEQERITISDRTKAGLRRAHKAGKVLGRPTLSLDMEQVRRRRARGESLRTIAKALKCSPSLLVKRLK